MFSRLRRLAAARCSAVRRLAAARVRPRPFRRPNTSRGEQAGDGLGFASRKEAAALFIDRIVLFVIAGPRARRKEAAAFFIDRIVLFVIAGRGGGAWGLFRARSSLFVSSAFGRLLFLVRIALFVWAPEKPPGAPIPALSSCFDVSFSPCWLQPHSGARAALALS